MLTVWTFYLFAPLIKFTIQIKLVITNRTSASRSNYFVITRSITNQIAFHSVQLPLLTRCLSQINLCPCFFTFLRQRKCRPCHRSNQVQRSNYPQNVYCYKTILNERILAETLPFVLFIFPIRYDLHNIASSLI